MEKRFIKKMKAALVLICALAMAVSLSSCKKSEEDGQNPAMNFVGNYACDRANILVEADGDDGMKTTVTWASSSAEETRWVMSGTFDSEKLVFEYNDCVKTDVVYDGDGKEKSSEEAYKEGHGLMTFRDGNPLTLTWQDDQEHQADEMVFEYAGTGGQE